MRESVIGSKKFYPTVMKSDGRVDFMILPTIPTDISPPGSYLIESTRSSETRHWIRS